MQLIVCAGGKETNNKMRRNTYRFKLNVQEPICCKSQVQHATSCAFIIYHAARILKEIARNWLKIHLTYLKA